MHIFNEISPIYWSSLVLISATIFTVFWILDARTHKELVHIDITDKELQTHRNILAVSMLMEASLVLMFWFPKQMLPLFIAFFITRTVHEFIDELHFHVDRCSANETTLHLAMWVSVLTKTFAMLFWGFFTQFNGILELPIAYYIWGIIVFGAMGLISMSEWKRGQ
jgi:hypothetical protein